MIFILLFVGVTSASQETQYSIDYGTYKVPATMVEDGNIITFSSSSEQSRMDDVIVDYNTKQVILKSDSRQTCSVAEIDDVVKQRIEESRQQIHQTQTLQALYFTFATRKPAGQTALQKEMVQHICTGYNVNYVQFLSADTTPPRQRHSCWGISLGSRWCIGVGNGRK